MKNLIIIGAGGMGRTFYDLAKESIGYNTEFVVKGFIDDNQNSLKDFENYPPIVGSIAAYIPKKEEVFVCSIGGTFRKKCIERILNIGGEFITLIHNTARIGTNVQLGKGNYIGAFTTVAADAKIGNFNFIQSYTIIGHDVVIGDWNRIDSHVMCVGGICIGNDTTIHTSAMLNHGVHIGNNVCIGACCFIINDVEQGATMFTSPARRLL